MKKDGKYRFTLQFGSDTEEQIKAGELLEQLGNKKSAIIVEALNDYMLSHPELLSPHCKIEVKAVSGYNQDNTPFSPRSTAVSCSSLISISCSAPTLRMISLFIVIIPVSSERQNCKSGFPFCKRSTSVV